MSAIPPCTGVREHDARSAWSRSASVSRPVGVSFSWHYQFGRGWLAGRCRGFTVARPHIGATGRRRLSMTVSGALRVPRMAVRGAARAVPDRMHSPSLSCNSPSCSSRLPSRSRARRARKTACSSSTPRLSRWPSSSSSTPLRRRRSPCRASRSARRPSSASLESAGGHRAALPGSGPLPTRESTQNSSDLRAHRTI